MKKIVLALAITCGACSSPKYSQEEVNAFQQEIDAYHKKRADYLVSPGGWVNVRGLYWLKEGINSFGSGVSNDLIFPEGKIAEKAGFFILKDSVVTLEVLPDAAITSDSVLFKSGVIYHPDSARAKTLEFGSLKWFVIKRSDKIGVRLRDFESENLKEFAGLESYPANLDWRFKARYEIPVGKKVNIANVLGQTIPTPVVATLTFNYNGNDYSLDAIDEDGKLFIIYGDATNGKETYGAGRYLYAELPTEGEFIDLDFNKSLNPPCAFTEFATCPLPPKQNVLPFAVPAGEKDYHKKL